MNLRQKKILYLLYFSPENQILKINKILKVQIQKLEVKCKQLFKMALYLIKIKWMIRNNESFFSMFGGAMMKTDAQHAIARLPNSSWEPKPGPI